MLARRDIERGVAAVTRALRESFAIPVIGIVIAILVIAMGALRAPGGYDWGSSLNVAFVILFAGWALGLGLRSAGKIVNLAATLEALSLFVAMCLLGTLMAAAAAIGTGEYVDPSLSSLDSRFFPFLDWPAFVLSLSGRETLLRTLGHVYASLSWQPFVLIGAAMIWGGLSHLNRVMNIWTACMLLCVLPFHWLPARGPYPYYGIGLDDMHGINVKLAWDAPARMDAIRDGTIDKIGTEGVSGLVTMPSFHACAAVVLACCFWRYPWLRWPALMLNVVMFAATLPIGGHYAVDLVAGGAIALLAVWWATWLERRQGAGSQGGLGLAGPVSPGTLRPAQAT